MYPDKPSQRILLIEDNPGDTRLIREYLNPSSPDGWEFYAAVTIAEALKLMSAHRFAVVMLDLNLPDSTGLDTLEVVKGHSPNLPIIVITGNEDREMAYAAIRAGAQEYLPKNSLDEELLRHTLQSAIERRQVEAEAQLNEARLQSLYNISQYDSENIQDLLDYTLQEAILLTRSRIGYIYFYDENRRLFTLNSWSKEVLPACLITDPQTEYELEKTGVWGEAVRQRRAILLNDFQAPHALKKGYPQGHVELKRFMTVPVFSGASIVAVAGVANKASDYDQKDVRQLSLLMDAVWKTVEREAAQEARRRRLQELEGMHAVTSALRSAEDLNAAVDILLERSLSALQAQDGAVWLYTQAVSGLRPAAVRGRFIEFENHSVFPNQGIIGQVFSSAHIKHEGVSALHELVQSSDEQPADAPWNAVCVPILSHKNSVIGVLSAAVPGATAISPETVKLLESLAEIGSATIDRLKALSESRRIASENACLLEDTQVRLEQIRSLRKIDIAITTSEDIRAILDTVLVQVRDRLGIDCASALIYDPADQTLEYAAGLGFRTPALRFTKLQLGQGYAGRVAFNGGILRLSNLSRRQTDFLRSPHFMQEGFDEYIGVPLIANGKIQGVLEIFHRSPLAPNKEWFDFLETLAGQAAIAIEYAGLVRDLEHSNTNLTRAYEATIEGWSQAMDLRDPETFGHTQRVTDLTLKLAARIGISEEELTNIRYGALLHDIGKIGIPDSILHKPGKLTPEEWALMHKHPIYAREMLLQIEYLHPALDIPYSHHEKWDGSGYPLGLKGEQIPLPARIFAVVDVYDALTSDRPYRAAWPKYKAFEYIVDQSGKHFDPQIVNSFMQIMHTSSLERTDHVQTDVPLQAAPPYSRAV